MSMKVSPKKPASSSSSRSAPKKKAPPKNTSKKAPPKTTSAKKPEASATSRRVFNRRRNNSNSAYASPAPGAASPVTTPRSSTPATTPASPAVRPATQTASPPVSALPSNAKPLESAPSKPLSPAAPAMPEASASAAVKPTDTPAVTAKTEKSASGFDLFNPASWSKSLGAGPNTPPATDAPSAKQDTASIKPDAGQGDKNTKPAGLGSFFDPKSWSESASSVMSGLSGNREAMRDSLGLKPDDKTKAAMQYVQQQLASPSGIGGADGRFNHADIPALSSSIAHHAVQHDPEVRQMVMDEMQRQAPGIGASMGVSEAIRRYPRLGSRNGPIGQKIRSTGASIGQQQAIQETTPGHPKFAEHWGKALGQAKPEVTRRAQDELSAGLSAKGIKPVSGQPLDNTPRTVTRQDMEAFKQQSDVMQRYSDMAEKKLGYGFDFPNGIAKADMDAIMKGEDPPGGQRVLKDPSNPIARFAFGDQFEQAKANFERDKAGRTPVKSSVGPSGTPPGAATPDMKGNAPRLYWDQQSGKAVPFKDGMDVSGMKGYYRHPNDADGHFRLLSPAEAASYGEQVKPVYVNENGQRTWE